MSDKVDFQEMLNVAAAFFLAGERCKPEIAFASYPSHSINSPTICNYSISIEIFLKLLCHISGVTSPKGRDGHRLRSLFDSLPCDIRCRLSNAIPRRYDDQKLQKVLDESDSAFVDWRYSYEGQQLTSSPNDLRHVVSACYITVRQMRPDLMCIYEKNWGHFDIDPDDFWFERSKQIEGMCKP